MKQGRYQKLKTTFYIYSFDTELYQNFMGTANSKTTVDKDTQTLTQEEKRKSNPSRTLKMVIKPQEERPREE